MAKSDGTGYQATTSGGTPKQKKVFQIVLLYAAFTIPWLVVSDWVVVQFVHDRALAEALDFGSDICMVAVTSVLLAWILSRFCRETMESLKQLQENEARLRVVEDHLPHSYIFQCAQDQARKPRFLHISAGVKQVHGVAADAVLLDANCLLGQLEVTQLPAFIDAQQKAARTLTDFEEELQFRRPDGRRGTVRVHSRPRINGSGRILWHGFVMDITTSKQAELALRESEEEFRVMFESASVGMGQANPYTRQVLRVNRKLEEITGYTAEELVKLKIPDFTHPEDRLRDGDLSKRLVQGEVSAVHLEKRYVRKDGRIVWVSVKTNLIRDAAGKPLRTVATVEDITERRRAEEERMLLITALEQTAESVMITDTQGMIVYVNPAFERISGYTRRECIGQNPRILQSGRQDATFYQHLWATIKGGNVWRGHFLNKRKDGTLFEEEATISPIRDSSGKIINYMAIKLDVSRQMELENQFRQAQKLEAIGQLAGGVAHDFNNILTSILMQVELGCMDEGISSPACEGFSQIRKDAERAASLTRQLLLFSRRQVMQLQDINLNDLVTSLAKMLQRVIGEDVRLQLNLHPISLMTRADAGMIDQVALNLAVNARDAMPDGGKLLIETSEETLDEKAIQNGADLVPGRYVCLTVADNGSGIAPEVMPRIFEPFFTTKPPGKGTGLGLATVFGIVKQHRGWITVDTQPGQGSKFKVFLPAIAKGPTVNDTEAPVKPKGGHETVLLAEDEPMVRHSLETVLARAGYTVLAAANGAEALELWAGHRSEVALLFTDLVMPAGVSGQQLARQLQSEKPDLKVLYTSGYSVEIAGREIELRSGENFMQKPIRPDILLKTVRSCLDQ